jgi:probable addiction module antidote protein
MPKRTRSYRSSLLEDLQNPKEAAQYLNAALEDSDEMFLMALRDVAEARQMAKVAEAAGIARESIYRILTSGGNPTYTTLRGILRAIGMGLEIVPEHKDIAWLEVVEHRYAEAGTIQQKIGESANEARDPNANAGCLVWHEAMGIAGAHLQSENWQLTA